MTTQNPSQTETSKSGILVMTLAIIVALCGVFAFALLTEQPTMVRVGILVGCLIVGAVIGWFSAPGKAFAVYCRASYDELRRVVWPTRKETVNTTGLVCGFVVLVSFFLFIVDSIIDLVLRLIL